MSGGYFGWHVAQLLGYVTSPSSVRTCLISTCRRFRMAITMWMKRGRRLSLADYDRGPKSTRGAIAAGAC